MKSNIIAIVLLALTALLATANASTDHPHRGIDGDPPELFFTVLQDGDNGINIDDLPDKLGISFQTASLMKYADSDRNGCLNYREFGEFLRSEKGRQFIEEIFTDFGGDSRVYISMDTFFEWMKLKENDEKAKYLTKLFHVADIDKDGEINSDDLYNAVSSPIEATNPDNSTPT
ncbi:hypothetical protein IWQ61_010601 [Dispira simplex]|nr:hypothetical protein IWQ61_010601 [Dispira simplex]